MRIVRSAPAVLVVCVVVASLLPAHAALASYGDVPSSYWDSTQINYVAQWMSDYGSTTFNPTTNENRDYLARTLVTMFAPSEPTDPKITFSDLATSDPFYRYANVAVKLDWLQKYSNNRWAGGSAVPRSLLDQALVRARGLDSYAQGLAKIHEADGTPYVVGTRWPYMQIATHLRFHYNHATESMDLEVATNMHRDEVAYSLWRAKTLASWETSGLSIYNSVTLPALDPSNGTQLSQEQLTQFALNYVGYPYIWGGEWNAASPSGYCCGTQPQGGFDCSGFVWWVLKKYEDGYNAAQFRVYPGWSIHDRTSSAMAENAPTQLAWSSLQIGNLMFFASDGGHTWQDVDHVGIYVGNNWMMHSTDGGPQLEYVASGWYHDHFVWGRALKATSAATIHGDAPTGGDAPVAAG